MLLLVLLLYDIILLLVLLLYDIILLLVLLLYVLLLPASGASRHSGDPVSLHDTASSVSEQLSVVRRYKLSNDTNHDAVRHILHVGRVTGATHVDRQLRGMLFVIHNLVERGQS